MVSFKKLPSNGNVLFVAHTDKDGEEFSASYSGKVTVLSKDDHASTYTYTFVFLISDLLFVLFLCFHDGAYLYV